MIPVIIILTERDIRYPKNVKIIISLVIALIFQPFPYQMLGYKFLILSLFNKTVGSFIHIISLIITIYIY